MSQLPSRERYAKSATYKEPEDISISKKNCLRFSSIVLVHCLGG